MDDDDLIIPPSPWPVTGGHGLAVLLHLINGALLIGVALFSPPWAATRPLDGWGERFVDVGSADLQWGVTGMIVFATVVSIGFSTGLAVAGFRLVARFRTLEGARRNLVLIIALGVAHVLGCIAGVGAVVLVTGVAFVG